MFTDIAGYTTLKGKDSVRALGVLRIRREIQKPLVEKHGGKWLKEMDDGALPYLTVCWIRCYVQSNIHKEINSSMYKEKTLTSGNVIMMVAYVFFSL
jgi:hypothetical protein